ncbi:MAG: DUF2079 domain-containing protein [Chloroflexi bacterium]|nr:DUF2079 domain-containing protein [Chloroflexota bacterium]
MRPGFESLFHFAGRLSARPAFAIFSMAAAYTAITIYITFLIHGSYHTYAFDLGLFAQSMKHTLQGEILHHSVAGGSELANHFSPVLFFMVPLYWAFPFVQTLLVVQAAALGFSGYLVYRLAVEHGYSHRAAMIIAGLFFANPLVWGVALFDFHPVVFSIPALLVLFLGMKRKNIGLIGIGLFFALISREDVIIAVGAFGLAGLAYSFWKTKRIDRLFGVLLASAVVSYGIALGLSATLSPGESPALLSYFSNRYTYTGHGLYITVRVALWVLFSAGSLLLVTGYLVPLGLLPLLSLRWAFPGLLIMLSGMISSYPGQHEALLQYPAAAVPFLFMAFIDALPRVQKDRQICYWMNRTQGRARVYALAFMGIASLAIISVGRIDLAEFPDRHDLALDQVIAAVPDGATVTASNDIFPHLVSRTETYLPRHIGSETGIVAGDWGFPERETEYVIVDYLHKQQYMGGYWEDVIRKGLSERYQLVLEIDGARLYKLAHPDLVSTE